MLLHQKLQVSVEETKEEIDEILSYSKDEITKISSHSVNEIKKVTNSIDSIASMFNMACEGRYFLFFGNFQTKLNYY